VTRVAGVSATRLGLLLALSSAGCLLYTDPVNEAPRVRILPPDHKPTRSGITVLNADVEDDEDAAADLLGRLVWTMTPGPCDHPAGPPLRETGDRFTLMSGDLGDLCVRVVATDSRGAATESAPLALTIENHDPVAALQAVAARSSSGKVRLYAQVELSAAGSSDEDGDMLRYDGWTAHGPDGHDQPLGPCQAAPADPSRRCFPAQMPGRYQAGVMVDDGLRSKPASTSFEVDEDQPPCLLRTDPVPLQPLVLVPRGGKRIFEVLAADDDGEPFGTTPPALGPPVFVWSRADDGKPMVRLGRNAPRLDVSEGLFDDVRPGDKLRVRVEVRDRLREEQLQLRQIPPPCAETDDVCKVGECLRWVTWKVQFIQ
jgi:hypothetical protein